MENTGGILVNHTELMVQEYADSAVLMLSDGTRFDGHSFGSRGEISGEVVFNTAMTGYQEILTDPSYSGQMVTLTYPLVGNYGVNAMDSQSGKIHPSSLIIRELSGISSNHRSENDLGSYLAASGVVGIEGIDTRELVLRIRDAGAMNGIISTEDFDSSSLIRKVSAAPSMQGLDLVSDVTCEKLQRFETDRKPVAGASPAFSVVAFDFGIKRNILELLTAQGLEVTVVPAKTSAEAIHAMQPDGVFCSNGPGDPAAVGYAIETIRSLIGQYPMFGICLGHQILALALGAETYKLKFGHRGGNHPVRDEETRRIEITSQNHGFCVNPDTLPEGCEITHINMNDMTLEGFRHQEHGLLAIQYHPEASPGPNDSHYLFPRFRNLICKWKEGANS